MDIKAKIEITRSAINNLEDELRAAMKAGDTELEDRLRTKREELQDELTYWLDNPAEVVIDIDREAAADHMDAETAKHYGAGELSTEELQRGTDEYNERLDGFIELYYGKGN